MPKYFHSQKPHFEHLRKKWTTRHKAIQDRLWKKHHEPLRWLAQNVPARHIALMGLGGLMLLSTPATTPLLAAPPTFTSAIDSEVDQNAILAQKLSGVVPKEVRPLTAHEEDQIGRLLSEQFGFTVTAELNGKRLNRSYGLIGAEQHLYRYPGDNLYKHADTAEDWAMFGSSGVAPGLGAWGYFAPSEKDFSYLDKLREKYYIAVQTFLAPGFAENVAEYRDFFKFRKMLVVNPNTGQSVVVVIGDAGPATWTGKHLGGSPEVMHLLGLGMGPRKGPVLYFFIDDPQDKTRLGPVIAEGDQISGKHLANQL